MILVYTPRGTKRKTQAYLQEAVDKYLTNGRYDQRKSDMVAVAHRDKMAELQKQQAKKRRELHSWSMVYFRLEALFATTFVCEHVTQPQNPQAPSLQKPHMVTHGSRKRKKEVKGHVHA